jgi:hypothetical protein
MSEQLQPVDVIEAIMTTRAMRRYSDRPVSDATSRRVCVPRSRRPAGATCNRSSTWS